MRNAPRGAVVKPKNFWGTLKRLLKYMSLKKWLLLFAFLLSGTATILQIFTPKVLGSATTVIFEGMPVKKKRLIEV